VIRKYCHDDCDEVLDVWAAASAVAHRFLRCDFLERERHDIRNLHLRTADTWVWIDADRVVGFLSLVGNEVGALFVDPRRQRSGIGRALVDHARALRGELEVDVFAANTIGRAFYAKYGFVPLRQRVHEPTGQEVIRLRAPALPSSWRNFQFGGGNGGEGENG
jgi:putative acetyltransferase